MERRRLIGNAKDWYISDGLIAMWDGEFNAGDAHNGSATNWTDMIGGYVLSGTNATWGDKCANFGGSTYFTTTNTTVRNIMKTGKSVEVAVQLAETPTSAAQMIFCANGWYVIGSQALGVILKGFQPGGANVPQNYYPPIPDLNTHTLSIDYSTWSMYRDATSQTVVAKNGNGADNNSYYLGRRTYNSNPGLYFKGKLFCLRIYNKVLTADEIAHNYNIDLQRFT